MKPFRLLSATYKYRKWLSSGLFGLLLIFTGIAVFVYGTRIETVKLIVALLLTGAGIVFCFNCFRKIILALLQLTKNGQMPLSNNMLDIGRNIYRRSQLREGPKIAVIGGGTGISTMLRGLKMHTTNISAVITVADDGGSSGMLRKNLGMLPPGDIRNCILALAETEPQMDKLMQYRFKGGNLKGQSFGNLFLAAMSGISEDFETAVRNMSEVLAVTGTVLPVTSENINLIAELEDGTIIKGESRIGEHHLFHPGRIKRLYLDKTNVRPLESALAAIDNAEAVIIGPGSLYTSIIPNILVDNVVERIVKSKAVKIYVANIMTQPGETEGYTVYDHIEAIYRHANNERLFDYCIVNTQSIPEPVYQRYKADGAEAVRIDAARIKKLGIKLIERELVQLKDDLYIRHDPAKLADAVMDICNSI